MQENGENRLDGLTFSEIPKDGPMPYHLLLIADPARELVDAYLKESTTVVASLVGAIIGVVVLFPLTSDMLEIKNIAVQPEWAGRGIGTALLETAFQYAKARNHKSIRVGTANSSLGPLRLYQKLGFQVTGIKHGFFTDNYAEPIYEDGIQAIDMILLEKAL